MNRGIIVNKRVTTSGASLDSKVGTHQTDFGIPMYDKPPEHTITLDEFRKQALDRLQLLKQVE